MDMIDKALALGGATVMANVVVALFHIMATTQDVIHTILTK